jgi:hypothetical protein
LNLRPSGYESAGETAIEPDSPANVEVAVVAPVPEPLPNPAIAHAPEPRTIASDESEHARALLRAALALLDAAPGEARRLLEQALGLLEPAPDNVIRLVGRRPTP